MNLAAREMMGMFMVMNSSIWQLSSGRLFRRNNWVIFSPPRFGSTSGLFFIKHFFLINEKYFFKHLKYLQFNKKIN